MSSTNGPVPSAANRFGWDYAAEAARLPRLPFPIIDAHAHIHGKEAAALFLEACDLYGISDTWSQTTWDAVPMVREVMGDRIRFVAVPDWRSPDRKQAHGPAFLERIEQFHAIGSRMVKFWCAPRGIDYGREVGDERLMAIDHPNRIEAMQLAEKLGMIFMTHIADPDTWFATKYSDAGVYGHKRDHYLKWEELMDRFAGPWMCAHLGGWPEDLRFLSGLLARHDNLYLDTSATKWIVREVSRHPPGEVRDFFQQWRGRILFGSDIVTMDEHLTPAIDLDAKLDIMARASSRQEAFDLYASRYWALRTLWESDYEGESSIADPDLAMVDPQRFTEMDAPPLRGMSLPIDVLKSFYLDAAASFWPKPVERVA